MVNSNGQLTKKAFQTTSRRLNWSNYLAPTLPIGAQEGYSIVENSTLYILERLTLYMLLL